MDPGSGSSSGSLKNGVREERRHAHLRGASESIYSFISDVNAEIFNHSSDSNEKIPAGQFDILVDTSDSSSTPQEYRSESSGVTIYADAAESPSVDNSSDEFLSVSYPGVESTGDVSWKDHIGLSRGSSPGLQSVKPIKSPHRLSRAMSDFDFGLGEHRRTPPPLNVPSNRILSPLDQDEARTTTVHPPPTTPRSRKRTPLSGISVAQMNTRRGKLVNEGSPVATKRQKDINRKQSIPPGTSITPSSDSISSHGSGINITFGKVRQSSASKSLHSSVDSNGHLLPVRRVAGRSKSFIRRAGATTRTNHAFLVGFPTLPLLPMRDSPLKHDDRPGLVAALDVTDVERDMWGRPRASIKKSWLMVLGCTCFPPLLPFVAFGYFDNVWGTIDKSAKIAALFIAFLVLVAVTALVVAFSILGW